MECKLPELVVFLQDSNHQVFQDLCMEREQCSLENCELNHHNIYYMLKFEPENSTEPENIVSESCEGIVKKFDDPKNLLMEGKAAAEIADAISSSHDVPKLTSLDRELVDQKENQDQDLKLVSMESEFVSKEASCNKSGIADSISREGSANTKAENSTSTEDGTPRSLASLFADKNTEKLQAENSTSTEDGTPRSLASLFADKNTEKLPNREDVNPVVSATKQCHDNISIRSNSTNSTKSFAFPILASEWPGSPAKMVAPDRREFKRRSCRWRTCFDFCKF